MDSGEHNIQHSTHKSLAGRCDVKCLFDNPGTIIADFGSCVFHSAILIWMCQCFNGFPLWPALWRLSCPYFIKCFGGKWIMWPFTWSSGKLLLSENLCKPLCQVGFWRHRSWDIIRRRGEKRPWWWAEKVCASNRRICERKLHLAQLQGGA